MSGTDPRIGTTPKAIRPPEDRSEADVCPMEAEPALLDPEGGGEKREDGRKPGRNRRVFGGN